jgi:hypothetical protein
MKKNNKHQVSSQIFTASKDLRNLNFFWIGFIIYTLSYTLSATGYVNYLLFQGFQIIGLILIFFSLLSLIQFKIDDTYFKFIYSIYCVWLFFLVLKGARLLFDYDYLKTFLFDPTYGGMLYFSPLLALFPKQPFFYKRIFEIIYIFCIIYIIYDIIFIRNLINPDWENLQSLGIVELSSDLSFPCGFLLLTYKYHSNKKKVIAIITIALTLLFSVIRARRGLILMTSSIILASYLLYFFTSKKKILIVYLSVFAISLTAIYAVAIYKPNKNIFGSIMERGAEDTRTGVELYFYADMKLTDWIIGRGINGEYFCPGIEKDALTNYRNVIETGYLQIILKGGLISLALLLLITIPAIFNGLFYSKNLLSKAAAIWIFLALLSMYPATVNTFTLRYLLVWVSVGICYSKKIRNLTNNQVEEFFIPIPHSDLHKLTRDNQY